MKTDENDSLNKIHFILFPTYQNSVSKNNTTITKTLEDQRIREKRRNK